MVRETGPGPESEEDRKFEAYRVAENELDQVMRSWPTEKGADIDAFIRQMDEALAQTGKAWDEFKAAMEAAHQQEQAELDQ